VTHWLHFVFTFGLAFLSSISAHGQSREQTTRIIFPFAPGGSGDALTRLIAEHLHVSTGPSLSKTRLERADAWEVAAVKTAAPDGTTLLMAPIAPMCVYQHVYRSLGYDPFRDFQPITQVAIFDYAVAVGPHVAAKSLMELCRG